MCKIIPSLAALIIHAYLASLSLHEQFESTSFSLAGSDTASPSASCYHSLSANPAKLDPQVGRAESGNYGRLMPAGIYFTVGEGAYEMGVATRDVLTYFNHDNPTLSMALGFLRFRF